MAKDILKEAIADAKAVREVALANAKAALEEAFTPKLQSMLSAKLSEELEEDMYDEDEKDLELGEMMYDEDEKDMDEAMYDEDEKVDEMMYDEDEDSMDEEIDLEEILNELEVEEGDTKDDVVAEKKKDDDDEEVDLDEIMKPHYTADDVNKVNPSHDPNNLGYVHEDKDFDLDALLKEINDLEEEEISENEDAELEEMKPVKRLKKHMKKVLNPTMGGPGLEEGCGECDGTLQELEETKSALKTVKSELNEVNLLNSKLLYVNRIFKANTLDDAQKLRVVETLDKADSTKEAKLIYETIKDSFSIAKTKKVSKRTTRKPIKENFRKGIASKASGVSRVKKTAPKRAIISESDNMVNRFQKLANIKINE